IFAAIGNGDIIYMAIKRKTKLKPAELMTLNLAIFDLGISVAGKPFFVVSSLAHRWLFGWYGCCLYGWGSFFFGCGSLCTMTVVSFDRYLKICHMRYGFWIERHHAMLSLLLVWLYAAFWATMPLVGWGSYAPEPFGTSCTLNWRLAQTSAASQSFILTILVFCLILPAGIIIFSYSRIIVKVKSSRKEISRFNKCDNNSHDVLEIKLTKVAMLICAGFFIAWLPYAIVSVVSAFGKPDSVPIPVSVIPTLLAKSSPMYNPIIYQLIAWKCSCAKSSRLKVFNRMKEHYPPRYKAPVMRKQAFLNHSHRAQWAQVKQTFKQTLMQKYAGLNINTAIK
ncbi:hypothetical protein P4O66_008880, partial [Electrophorus voltai]